MLNRLYHLRRGHLISPGPMQSMDDRAESRGLLIRFPLKDCLQMMRPSIWSTGSMNVSSGWDEMQPFPAETLALWDDVSVPNSKICIRLFLANLLICLFHYLYLYQRVSLLQICTTPWWFGVV